MEDLGKSLPFAEGFIDAERAGKSAGEQHCLNCGTPLTGKYCGNCGQRDLPARQNLGDLLINFISSFYSFESKFFKTFKYLLFYPGKITAEYNAGKRESFYHPARMYVFLSFIFFLLFSTVFSTDDMDLEEKGDFKTVQDSLNVDSLVRENTKGLKFGYQPVEISTESKVAKTLAQYDSLQNALPAEKRDGYIKRYFERKGREVEAGATQGQIAKAFMNDMMENTPKMIFILMPFFALLLKLFYVRRDFYYSEHLIFTIFFYDFIYLIGSLIILASKVEWLWWLELGLYMWIFIYLYKAMRKVYKQGRAKTVIKFLLLNFLFLFVVSFGIAGLALIAFIRL
ncbi:DUF3667 domain-containing protein [Chryseotalea sanaruensis]|uniref:DUF3667 domain-containing protein n=1 Tax=Chryseotalea sanaruensis TaxID=2482724 RepID=A0A401U7E5_9BACT|nr:DUF3667 domain-containing protein [Chryseotalea sanaruensis]GCC50808.1 DUF3667 domain-containing protein [Chryseotalea sanaruensis]